MTDQFGARCANLWQRGSTEISLTCINRQQADFAYWPLTDHPDNKPASFYSTFPIAVQIFIEDEPLSIFNVDACRTH